MNNKFEELKMLFIGFKRPSGCRAAASALTAVGLMLAATQASAVIVYSGPVNLEIPTTTDGLYLNVVTGKYLPGGAGGSTVPGWDINLFGSAGLGFFSAFTPAGGSYVVSSGITVANLAPGTLVSGGSTFGNGGTSATAQWELNSSNNYFGFRFTNEADGQVHYGWAQFALGTTITDSSRRLVAYAYESTAGLGTPLGPVPEPSTYALLGVGLAGMLLAARRRR